MNLYAQDLSLLDYNFNFGGFSPDSIDEPFSLHRTLLNSGLTHHDEDYYHHPSVHDNARYGRSTENRVAPNRPSPPPSHRHDGTSPLPLGMDWSPPPRKWEGRESVWPHDPRTGWSYCVVIPSWTFLLESRGSDPVVFYRVKVGIQSPEGVTTVRVILRRYNDFLKLFSELKKAFPMKVLPPAPPKKLRRIKSQELLEQRRCSLEDWMEKLLSDIDLSRSFQIATFLELEAAVRSSFNDIDQQGSDVNSSTSGAVPSSLLKANSDVSVVLGNLSMASDYGDETPSEISELGATKHGVDNFTDFGMGTSTSGQDLIDPIESNVTLGMFDRNFIQERPRFSRSKLSTEVEGRIIATDQISEDVTNVKPLHLDGTEFVPELVDYKQSGHSRRRSAESVGSDLSSVRASELIGDADLPGGSGGPSSAYTSINSVLRSPRDLFVTLPSDERHKLNRVLTTLQQRLATAKTDMEDLIARLNQEAAVRQFLMTKVKDLEVELETTRQNCKENLQQAVLTEKERFTQMQWDVEELRGKCMELELKLKSEEEEKVHAQSTKMSIMDEKKMLLQELIVAREQLNDLQKHHEEFELKSKTDVKLLVKEVKSLRNSHSELKQELSRLMKEKLEVERVLQKETQRTELADTANVKLLHECGILRSRLQECSVSFLVEEEDKLILDASLPSDAIDLLATSDNRIGLLLAEAQLLAQDIENAVRIVGESRSDRNLNGGNQRKSDDELRLMLTDILVDNAKLRKQVNSVIRCTLKTSAKAEDNGEDNDDEDALLRKTVLGIFLER
ncbi:Phox domain containing protein [Parasponia andersonii]|uniref:Phox domain containing protein n=1 Tax=Parasponia andersonii TaxID=3476 RepID=A0A2P5BH17_PARAD|nr:Phox domain containing protein [Parasponia andersonii]